MEIKTVLAVDRFVEEMGLISQQHGGARIAGRIIGLLIVEGRELSLQQISERLGVSRASVSTNARQLAKQGSLRLTSHAGDRQDYYEVLAGPYFEMLDDMAKQFQRHARVIANCADQLRAEAPEAAPRAADLSKFFEKSAEILQNWATTLREEKAPGKDDQ
jgi:DNA-binding transcriptional regulator GbsR (MarR family)